MRCLNSNCDADQIEKDDNFCYKCGHWTARGFSFLKDNSNIKFITKGSTIKQNDRLIVLGSLFAILFSSFYLILIIRGDDLFRPYFYLKKQVLNYIYGYNISLIKTDNKYDKKSINNYNDAVSLIEKDFNEQKIYCFNEYEVDNIANNIEKEYQIPSVSFCDMALEESSKIKEVIDRMYLLFPNIKGALTNISITNASTNLEYVARFQPMYQFVNINEGINLYNKVNKTQILINSYYFLNENIIKKPIESIVGIDWYVEGATWESTIAHEFGHYISFVILLKKNNIDNITFETINNHDKINNIINEFNSGSYSLNLLIEAVNNYNKRYLTNLTIKEFANSISKYAGLEDKNGNIIADETIAEAIHDYYLHGDNMNLCSREIIDLVKNNL